MSYYSEWKNPGQRDASNTAMVQTQTARPTKTPDSVSLTQTARPTKTARPTQINAGQSALIPGVLQADFVINLENRFAMNCGDITEGGGYYSHFCQKSNSVAMLTAIVYGRGIVSVDFITAAVCQFEDPNVTLPETFLGFIATIPFLGDDAMQKQASAWVIDNIPQIGASYTEIKTVMKNINFTLSGTSMATVLEIGDLK